MSTVAPREPFLPDRKARTCELPPTTGLGEAQLFIGEGRNSLEVVVVDTDGRPRADAMRSAWKSRHEGRPIPLLLVACYGDMASVCGPSGPDPALRHELDRGVVEHICEEALACDDRHAAHESLRNSLPAVDSEHPGLRNEGFLARHALIAVAPDRPDWHRAGQQARQAIGASGDALLKALGYQSERHDNLTFILRGKAGDRLALGVLLKREELPELGAARFHDNSPVTYGLSVARREGLPWLVITQGSRIRVYPVRSGVGVAARSRTETFIELHTGLLRSDQSALLWLLASAEALAQDGTLSQILEASQRFAGELARDLRERIYTKVVPALAEAIARERRLSRPTAADLSDTYEMTLVLLYRLLFIAYAEDKDLLPYSRNGLYQKRSLKEMARELAETRRSDGRWGEGTARWDEVTAICRAVDVGNPEWGVPAYNGGLFAAEEAVSRAGHLLTTIRLRDAEFGPILADLLLIEADGTLGPVDFRCLGVREFGTIYEGLLESELSLAQTDLAVGSDDQWRPAAKGDEIAARKGTVYLHNRSGARKSSGSYFTKPFAVDHLLERSLDPALDEHLERVAAIENDELASQALFDFRVADIAMGSGHFLVAAVDRIEERVSSWLAEHPQALRSLRAELLTLRRAASSALSDEAAAADIEDSQLLRRLIARRCIYGVDRSPVAVQLARLAIWVHTFVPGLPLSLLDHNLVVGDSLIGVGTKGEIERALEQARTEDRDIKVGKGKTRSSYGKGRGQIASLFEVDLVRQLGEALEPLQRLGRLADATPADVKRARAAYAEAQRAVEPARKLCDLITATRIGALSTKDLEPLARMSWSEFVSRWAKLVEIRNASKALSGLCPLHFPTAFPEVFLRERAGFDVIVGNPPWEEATVEEDAFWARHAPGLRSLPQREQETQKARLRRDRPDLAAVLDAERHAAEVLRAALTSGPYPGMETGDPDLYKAFCWRFWHLASADGGRVGVVLPRSALSAKGSTAFREVVFAGSEVTDVTMLLNRGQWFFEEVHPQYTIGLVALTKRSSGTNSLKLQGPYPSLQRYGLGMLAQPTVFAVEDVRSWNDTASLPLLPTDESVGVFAQLRKAPRLDLDDGRSWRARPHRELDATNDKELMDLESKSCPKGFWPVFKGESFDLWTPDTGTYYAWADPDVVLPVLQTKRERGLRNSRSPFSEFDAAWIADAGTQPCLHPRIAFRDVTRSTDSRTVRAALLPGRVFVTNKGPYLLWPRGNNCDHAFLLGAVSSIPLDWYARRFVEVGLNFFIFNPLPIPRPGARDKLRKRVIELAGRLACPDGRFAEWAEVVGVECGPLASDVRDDMIHEIDAVACLLYDLDEMQVVHVFETFHEGWNHEPRLRAVLEHYRAWKTKR